MSDISIAASAASAATTLVSASPAFVTIFGITFNPMGVWIAFMLIAILILFWRIQRSDKLDFADMLTKDGKSVSLSKVLQLIGGMTATWVIIKLTLMGGLTEAVFGLYLTYVGAIEGYSKFVSAKYGYTEKSIKEANPE